MASRADDNTDTWMLFGSGRATRVDVGLHESGERVHSAKAAYVIKECDAAMKDAAERGCLAALEWLGRRFGEVPAHRVSFDLPDVPAGQDIGGASSGLAFAIAVARKVCAGSHVAVAAVGELGSGLSGGPVRGVKDIEAKVEGVLACLPNGGRLVYPRSNDGEIPASLRERLRDQGVDAKAVANVDGALDWLFPSHATPSTDSGETAAATARPVASRRSRASAVWAVAIALAGVAAAAIWYERADQAAHHASPAAGDDVVAPDGTAETESGTPIAARQATAVSVGGDADSGFESSVNPAGRDGPPGPAAAAAAAESMDTSSHPMVDTPKETADAGFD